MDSIICLVFQSMAAYWIDILKCLRPSEKTQLFRGVLLNFPSVCSDSITAFSHLASPRIFLTDLGSLELSYRAKGVEQTVDVTLPFPASMGLYLHEVTDIF